MRSIRGTARSHSASPGRDSGRDCGDDPPLCLSGVSYPPRERLDVRGCFAPVAFEFGTVS